MIREPLHPTHYRRWLLRALLLLAGTGAAASLRRFRRVVVAGDSMRPAFEEGDRLVVGPAGPVRAGHVVAFPDPRHPDRLLVKRVHSSEGGLLDVRGDNAAASTDSRHFGLVDRGGVLGRVVYRYAPPARAGWWPQ